MSKVKGGAPQGAPKKDFQAMYYHLADVFTKYRQYVIGGLLLVIVAVVGIVFFNNSRKANNEKASVELSRVMKSYETGNYQEAIDGKPGTKVLGLKKIVDLYGSTENGEMAKVLLGNSYFFLGKIQEAEKYYKDYSGGNLLYQAAAYAGMAGCLEAAKDNKNENLEKAADYFLKASKLLETNVLNPVYMTNAAANYIEIGKKAEALELLKTIKREYAKSPYIRDADKYLQALEVE